MKTLDELLDEGRNFKEINNIMKYKPYKAGWHNARDFINIETLLKLDYIRITKASGEIFFSDGKLMHRMDYIGGGFVIPNCTWISNLTFSESDISEIILSEGIKIIGSAAFENSNLLKIFIPKTVERFGCDSFSGIPNIAKIYYEGNEKDFQNIKNITNSGVEIENVLYGCNVSQIEFEYIRHLEQEIEK